MGEYLVGPDGLRVEPVQLTPGSAHWIFARMVEPAARPGEVWYRVTRGGAAVGGGYFQLDQLQEIVNLADLRAPEQAGEESA
ncbi:hypothetical protein ACBJ59_10500 [Nonomuraea sp. MTCD27]|uniref:hypothetical protein n=1 Tax=Nonomuraea sp. MTCD27 TaxID=1676747 RepID=UPI0035C21CF3